MFGHKPAPAAAHRPLCAPEMLPVMQWVWWEQELQDRTPAGPCAPAAPSGEGRTQKASSDLWEISLPAIHCCIP